VPTKLFNWQIEEESTDCYTILTSTGKQIGAIQVADESVKGSKEFWAVYFAVSDMERSMNAIEQAGGKRGGTYEHAFGTQGLAYDSQGAAFFLLQKGSKTKMTSSTSAEPISTNIKWRSLIGLIGIYLIILFEQDWGWGVLFLFWVLPDPMSGTTYFIEPLSRQFNPFLYWAVVLTWIVLSLYLLLDVQV
jgi:predicted enzyme related to lactoylglutathione lyase